MYKVTQSFRSAASKPSIPAHPRLDWSAGGGKGRGDVSGQFTLQVSRCRSQSRAGHRRHAASEAGSRVVDDYRVGQIK